MAVLMIVAHERLQTVVWSVMYVTHQAVEALIACSCPFGHFSCAAANLPKQLETYEAGAVEGLHNICCGISSKVSWFFKVFGFE